MGRLLGVVFVWQTKGRARCLGLDAYAPTVEALVARYKYRAVYLATDSEDVLREASRRWPDSYLRVLYQPLNRTRYNVFGTAAARHTGLTIERLLWAKQYAPTRLQLGLTPAREFDECLVDLFLLARADGFVGSFTSNLDRIAYALMAAYASSSASGSGGATCLKPYASAGAYWCFDHARRTGRTVDGGSFDC